jgi:hypothetical protein
MGNQLPMFGRSLLPSSSEESKKPFYVYGMMISKKESTQGHR